MATLDRTKIAKPSPIVEDEQGQLLARHGISREVIRELGIHSAPVTQLWFEMFKNGVIPVSMR